MSAFDDEYLEGEFEVLGNPAQEVVGLLSDSEADRYEPLLDALGEDSDDPEVSRLANQLLASHGSELSSLTRAMVQSLATTKL